MRYTFPPLTEVYPPTTPKMGRVHAITLFRDSTGKTISLSYAKLVIDTNFPDSENIPLADLGQLIAQYYQD
jgi:hypothetical protein